MFGGVVELLGVWGVVGLLDGCLGVVGLLVGCLGGWSFWGRARMFGGVKWVAARRW